MLAELTEWWLLRKARRIERKIRPIDKARREEMRNMPPGVISTPRYQALHKKYISLCVEQEILRTKRSENHRKLKNL